MSDFLNFIQDEGLELSYGDDGIYCAGLAWGNRQAVIDELNQRAISQAAHLKRVQEHNAKLQKRLNENGLPWQDLL